MNSYKRFSEVYRTVEWLKHPTGTFLEEWRIKAAYNRYLKVTGEEPLP